MIRSRTHMVMCVRKPNNEILTNVEGISSLCERHGVLGLPFLRGIVALFETLYLGFKGLFFSANVVAEEEGVKFTYKEFAVVGALALGLVSFLIILVIIGMKIAIRRDEVEILQLLGASPGYIRWPFVIEGMFYGSGGAFLAWALAYLLLLYATPFLVEFLRGVPLLPVPVV